MKKGFVIILILAGSSIFAQSAGTDSGESSLSNQWGVFAKAWSSVDDGQTYNETISSSSYTRLFLSGDVDAYAWVRAIANQGNYVTTDIDSYWIVRGGCGNVGDQQVYNDYSNNGSACNVSNQVLAEFTPCRETAVDIYWTLVASARCPIGNPNPYAYAYSDLTFYW